MEMQAQFTMQSFNATPQKKKGTFLYHLKDLCPLKRNTVSQIKESKPVPKDDKLPKVKQKSTLILSLYKLQTSDIFSYFISRFTSYSNAHTE